MTPSTLGDVVGLADAAVSRCRATPGPAIDGSPARFTVGRDGETIVDVRFGAHRCTTLLACCEATARSVTGSTIAHAAQLEPADVLALVRGVSPSKADRAVVAVTSLRAALREADVPTSLPGIGRRP